MKIFKYKQLDNRGFTLIELLVSIGVLAVISGVIITAFVSLTSAYDRADVITKVNHEGNRVMEILTRLVRNSINAEAASNVLTLTIPEEDTNLEYSTNGNCSQVIIQLKSTGGNDGIQKETTGTCGPSPMCETGSVCTLTSDDVHISSLIITVNGSQTEPDLVDISFEMTQEQSLSDPEQMAGMHFERVVSTRAY